MRFVLVNGRIPCPKTFCVFCCEPIHASYLREISTQLPFCDNVCYALSSDSRISNIGKTKAAGSCSRLLLVACAQGRQLENALSELAAINRQRSNSSRRLTDVATQTLRCKLTHIAAEILILQFLSQFASRPVVRQDLPASAFVNFPRSRNRKAFSPVVGRAGTHIATPSATTMLTGPSGQGTTRTKGEDAHLRS
jgi:hypothetical protein